MKKSETLVLVMILLLLMIPSYVVSDEIRWYDAGGTQCATSPGNFDTFPFYEVCCDVEGTTKVSYCADGECSNRVNSYVINWDSDQSSCECYSKTWLSGNVMFESSLMKCCGDDGGENYITQGIGSEACCDNSNDCVDRTNRCGSEYGKEITCAPTDGFDDDCDGNTDCSDSDCAFEIVCLGCNMEDCDNTIDDDCDNYVDCEDNDCIGDPACVGCIAEDCTDGLDNDCDSKVDCSDSDCLGLPSCSGCSKEICDDKLDNDCDGLVDNADKDCPGCPAGTALCQDGSCSGDCDTTDGGKQGCISKDGVCGEGEGCACEDCSGERSSCENYLVCDPFYKLCLCPAGTTLCSDGSCRSSCNICSNGILEEGEECDGSVMGSGINECGKIDNFTDGNLICDDSCFLNTNSCNNGVAGSCGDNVVNVGETCDGVNFDGKTCASFDFDRGYLSCFEPGTLHECHFDTSGCFDSSDSCVDDGVCDVSGGEDCTCQDCLGKQALCGYGQVCDMTGKCKCMDGTTLCGDGTCRPPEECVTFPSCNNDGICDLGEGCSCGDCESKTDNCRSSSSCVNGLCESCSLESTYWSEECIGSNVEDGLSLVVVGSRGCKGKVVSFEIWEDKLLGADVKLDGQPETPQAVFNQDYEAEVKWTPINLPGDSTNSYYFKAKIGEREIKSSDVEVRECDPTCDSDCDGVCDLGFTDADCSILGAGACSGSDQALLTPWCADVDENGMSSGQVTCAAFYDCTPGWWEKEGKTPASLGWDIDPRGLLEWSDCEQTDFGPLRSRSICPEGLGDSCCSNQQTCYCKIPDPSQTAGLNCSLSQFKPSVEKSCLSEGKFSFFSDINIIIFLILITLFYLFRGKIEIKSTNKRKLR